MPVETATYLADLDSSLPAHTDGLNQADSHMRLIKSAIKATFPGFTSAALSATQAQIDAAINAVLGTVAIRYVLGTAALPGITPVGDPNTGIYSPGADQLGFAVNGAAAATVAADKTWTFPGNIAITGTLGVTGNATFSGTLGAGATTVASLSCTGAASFAGAITGAAATFSGLVTHSSLAHMLLAGGTTAERSGVAVKSFRYSTTFGVPEFADGNSWRQLVVAQPIAAGFKNLVITNDGTTPNSKVSLTADAVTAETSGGIAFRSPALTLTIDAGVVGANGIDAAALTNNTWFSVWVIYNPTTNTWAGLLSTSATAPTLPSGYTASARLGWFRTNGSAQLKRIIQRGRTVQYIIGVNPATTPDVAHGAAGTYASGSPTLASVSISAFVPTTAARIHVSATNRSGLGTGAASNVMVAPNTSWGGAANGPSGANGNTYPLWITGNADNAMSAWLMLESTNIAWAADTSNGALACLGWEDNI